MTKVSIPFGDKTYYIEKATLRLAALYINGGKDIQTRKRLLEETKDQAEGIEKWGLTLQQEFFVKLCDVAVELATEALGTTFDNNYTP